MGPITGVLSTGRLLTTTTLVRVTPPELLTVPEKTSCPPGGGATGGQALVTLSFGTSTVSGAQLVTLVQMPVTSMQYWPASPNVTPLTVTDLLVWPGNAKPLRVQR